MPTQILVCDDVNIVDAVDAKESVASVKHLICIGNEGSTQGCTPIRSDIRPTIEFVSLTEIKLGIGPLVKLQ